MSSVQLHGSLRVKTQYDPAQKGAFDYAHILTTRQVMSPSSEGHQIGRSLTPRTRRAVHQGREARDERVIATEGEIETFSADLVSSFNVLQEQLDSLNKDNKQQPARLMSCRVQ
eukprot:2869011-Amphidinium_carterae.1